MESEEIMDMGGGGAYAAPVDRYGSSIITLTNTDATVKRAEMFLRNMTENINGDLIPCGEPLMNDLGINNTIGALQSIVNQVSMMSNLNEKEISNIALNFADYLIADIMMNRVNYGIKTYSTARRIRMNIINMAYIGLKRAYESGLSDKKFLRGSVMENYHMVEQKNSNKGVLSSLNPWKK